MSNNFSGITRTFYDNLRAVDTKTEDKDVNPAYCRALQKGIIKISDDTACISDYNINGEIGQKVPSDGMYHVFHDLDKAMHPVTGTEVFKNLKSISQCEALPYRKFILQLECKKGLDVRDVNIRTQCLMQVCCYIYQMALKTVPGANTTSSKFWDDNGYKFPKVVLLASDVSCLLIPTKHLRQYLTDVSHWVGWGSASDVHTKAENRVVYNQMKEDVVISRATTLKCGDEHYVETICDLILKLGTDTDIASDLTVTNIYRAFDYFDMYVLDSKEREKLGNRKEIEMFIQLFFSEDDATVGKIKKHDQFENKITYKGEVYKINSDAYNVFAGLFSQKEYSRSEIKDLTAVTDRLIEDADRRRRGDFYTPTVWVDEAYKLLDKNLGADWKERCIVWDCAWGTGNLTRDYRFNELYASTLEAGDLNVAEIYNQGGTRSNRNGTKFQYDFLNDDVEEFELAKETLAKPFERWKNTDSYKAASKYFNLTQYKDMCENLYSRGALTEETKLETDKAYDKAVEILMDTKLAKVGGNLMGGLIKGREIVFLINPPYGTAKNGGTDTVSKKGVAMTCMNKVMENDDLGACRQQLYAQFLYRIHIIANLFNVKTQVGIFAPPAYVTGSTYKKFRDRMIELKPLTGFILQGSQFADVKDSWGIAFTLLNELGNWNNYKVDVLDYSSGTINTVMNKLIYNLDNEEQSLSDWIKPLGKGVDYPQMSSAIAWKETGRGKLIPGAFGYMMFNANNIEQSKQFVSITTSCMAGANGVSITKDNIDKCLAGFAARRLMVTECNWINCKDEYMIPDTSHPKYEEWQNDSIVYSLFNTGSNQSSLRDIEYNGRTWDIQNEFFWMSSDVIEKLADGSLIKALNDNRYQNSEILDDLEKFGDHERYVYLRLKELRDNNKLSAEALAVLNKAEDLVLSSFKYRKDFNERHPEYQINTWDAGWYQIKGMLKDYDKEGLKEFNSLYDTLANKMRPLVYELGFLYK